MRISDWSSDVCSSDLPTRPRAGKTRNCSSHKPPTQNVWASCQVMMPARAGCRSDVADFDNLVLDQPTGRFDGYDITFFLADQCAGNRRTDRKLALLDVSFIVANDLVGHLLVGLDIGDIHSGTEDYLASRRDVGDIDNLGVLQSTPDVADTRLNHALLLTRSMILGVLLQIAHFARLGARLGEIG